jgi:N6-adenosine-specific RNA methylase IME4
MKFKCIVADPPYSFSDKLKMSSVKRSADSNYKTLVMSDIKALKVKELAEDDSFLALWVPSAMLEDGLEILKLWGFKYKQNCIWVKTKTQPLAGLLKAISRGNIKNYIDITKAFDLNEVLNFKMGHFFRQTHEICLIGTRGKMSKDLLNRSQRSVHLYPAMKHSKKPEQLQDMLDIMFKGNKLELFARRDRPNWTCKGNECFSSLGEDIRDSVEGLIKL